MPDLTPEMLAELRRLLDAATPGPWRDEMYTVCAECCRDDVYQTEDCASYHDHKPDEAHHCPTARALDGGAES